MKQILLIDDEQAMVALGQVLANHLPRSGVVALQGDLGAGKTTLVRAILRGLGWQGVVPSPSYTLLELYELDDRAICHLDFYRLTAIDEVEMLGLRDYFNDDTLLLVEWPQQVIGALPVPVVDCTIELVDGGEQRRITFDSEVAPLMAALKDD